jgi:hypothetical protein
MAYHRDHSQSPEVGKPPLVPATQVIVTQLQQFAEKRCKITLKSSRKRETLQECQPLSELPPDGDNHEAHFALRSWRFCIAHRGATEGRYVGRHGDESAAVRGGDHASRM